MSRGRTALAALLLGAAGCTPAAPSAAPGAEVPRSTLPPEETVRPEELTPHVRALAADSMEGRRFGTPGGARARAYLVAAFRRVGLQPVGAGFEHPVELRRAGGAPVRGANVVGMVRGRTSPERYLVVTAHYDHLGVRDGQVYNGADDNASGVAALLAIADHFRRHPPEHSLLFAALDAEEGPGVGANAVAGGSPVPAASIVMNVNMDMVGRNAKNELYAAGLHHHPGLKVYLDSVAARAPLTLRFGHDRPQDGENDWTTQSDHRAFHAAGIPWIYFGVEDHPDYHRPSDDPERLMPAFHAAAATTVLNAVHTLDRNLDAIARLPRRAAGR